MGVKLMVEVLDYAPEEATPAERLVLLALAEKASDETRQVWGSALSRARLLHRTGLSSSGLKKVLARLAERGLEVRVPITTDKAGRPVFAHDGRATDYRVPVLRGDLLGNPLDEERGPYEEPTDGREGTSEGTHRDPAGSPLQAERGPSEVPPSLSPSTSPSAARDDELQGGAAAVRRKLGPGVDADLIAARVRDRSTGPIRNLESYIDRIPVEDLTRFRDKPAAAGDSARCRHQRVRGMEVIGRGHHASRICSECEQENPAYVEAAS